VSQGAVADPDMAAAAEPSGLSEDVNPNLTTSGPLQRSRGNCHVSPVVSAWVLASPQVVGYGL
jgi:hypothetical protein